MLRSNVQWVRTSLWGQKEISPFCWPVVSIASILTTMIYMPTGMWSPWWLRCSREFGGPDVVRLAQFFEARGSQDIRNPNPGIRKMKMKWMRFYTAMASAMFTSEWWPMFYPYPQYGLCGGRSFSCWNSGRRWELTSLDSWKMLRAFACTSCIPPAVRQIQRSLISWPKRSWMTWLCLIPWRTVILWTIIPRVCRGFTGIFHQFVSPFSHAETTCEHAGRIIFFHQFPISPWFCFNFTIFTKCSLKVGKETTAFKPGRKIPGNWGWVAVFECL